ncbi:MAG: hypothetical protein VKN33_04700 [Candidatus Sericytochromatia bacterium]|nr:hypothetical protein [Candidatus Sericytochromatia bacterium]
MSQKAPHIDVQIIQDFLERLDEAGETLRELLDDVPPSDSPVLRVYLDGAAFLEAGYLMIEQLAPQFPDVFTALSAHYEPVFSEATKGRIGWNEALEALPEFLREYALDRAAAVIDGDE